MARHLLRSLVAASFIVAAFCQAAEPQNYALLIAVSEYSHPEMNQPKLAYPEADAKAVGEFLSARGYDVDYLLGKAATQKAIEAKLDGLSQKGDAAGAAVVGLWGHGVEFAETEEAMFCPYDAKLRIVKDSQGNVLQSDEGQPQIEPDPATLVGMTRLLAGLRICGAGNRLLLADCCRNSPNQPRGRAFGSQVKLSDLPRDSAAIFACSASERAFEDARWGHGAMTKCLLDLLPEMATEESDVNAVTGKLRRNVADLVRTASGGRDAQTVHPIVNGIVDLRLKRPAVGPSPVVPRPEPVAMKSDATKPEPAPQSRSMLGTKAGEVRTLVADPKIEFCWCPPGSFKMGSPKSDADASFDEEPQVYVTLTRGFWLEKTELTQGSWKAVMGTEPWKEKDPDGVRHRVGTDYPAVFVSWEDAVSYCAKLTERERGAGRLPAEWKYELPTEAQWEYACRAGTKSPYSFGDNASQVGDYAWYGAIADDIGEGYAHRVGTKRANPWGLSDVHGNVCEWCRDSYSSSLPGGRDPYVSEGSTAAHRGGCWFESAGRVRSAARSGNYASIRASYLGFRLACVPSE